MVNPKVNGALNVIRDSISTPIIASALSSATISVKHVRDLGKIVSHAKMVTIAQLEKQIVTFSVQGIVPPALLGPAVAVTLGISIPRPTVRLPVTKIARRVHQVTCAHNANLDIIPLRSIHTVIIHVRITVTHARQILIALPAITVFSEQLVISSVLMDVVPVIVTSLTGRAVLAEVDLPEVSVTNVLPGDLESYARVLVQ